MIGSVAAWPFASALGLAVMGTAVISLVSPSLGLAWLACSSADLLPIGLSCVLRSRQTFAMSWLAGALFRLPVAFLVGSIFQGDQRVTDGLPFVYFFSLLLSVTIAAVILRAHEEAASR